MHHLQWWKQYYNAYDFKLAVMRLNQISQSIHDTHKKRCTNALTRTSKDHKIVLISLPTWYCTHIWEQTVVNKCLIISSGLVAESIGENSVLQIQNLLTFSVSFVLWWRTSSAIGWSRCFTLARCMIFLISRLHPTGVKWLDQRITEEKFCQRTKLSENMSKLWTCKRLYSPICPIKVAKFITNYLTYHNHHTTTLFHIHCLLPQFLGFINTKCSHNSQHQFPLWFI